ncbi:MAG: 4-hydroxythreonine-4-phosphate dehydrogenase PdxA [Bdellovibrionales bacterium]
MDKSVYRKQVGSVMEAMQESHIEDTVLFDICQDINPTYFVKEAAELALQKKINALVTAPLSKPLISESGLNVVGHTGLFRMLVPNKSLFMAFLGVEFNVVLATDHIPLGSVANSISPEKIIECILESNRLRQQLSPDLINRPLGLLGLNPHAGDSGLIGTEESRFFNAIVSECRSMGIPIEGPLVPDVAFQKHNWTRYSLFISLYHDQGLIPFKMIHGQDSGVHVTLGLPFLRTSVDHGTAKDIFNQNKAKPDSMREALEWALKHC